MRRSQKAFASWRRMKLIAARWIPSARIRHPLAATALPRPTPEVGAACVSSACSDLSGARGQLALLPGGGRRSGKQASAPGISYWPSSTRRPLHGVADVQSRRRPFAPLIINSGSAATSRRVAPRPGPRRRGPWGRLHAGSCAAPVADPALAQLGDPLSMRRTWSRPAPSGPSPEARFPHSHVAGDLRRRRWR